MIPLVVLIVAFTAFLLLFRFRTQTWQIAAALACGLGTMMIFTGIGHFVYTEGMARMIPSFFPFPRWLVIITGVFEIFFGVALFFCRYRFAAAALLVAFYVCVLPANIHAAANNINYKDADAGGEGLEYLWFRVPLQLLFIACAIYVASASKRKHSQNTSVR